MSNIIDFPVQVKIKTCGDCKKFDWCYAKSTLLLNYDKSDYEESKNIPACEDIKS